MTKTDLHARLLAAITARQEPTCCGEPMVHNSFTGEFECADAYFTLADEGWDELGLALVTAEDVGLALAPLLEHWRASRIPDGIDIEEQP